MEIKIESRAGTACFEAGDGDKVLFAGLRAGLTLPYDCATGTCGMCKARVQSGTVDLLWPQAPGLAKIQPGKGDILMCQSRATGPCVLRVPANIATSVSPVRPDHGTARIASIKMLTVDVMHIEVELGAPMAFDAGQFVVLTAPGLEGARAYSMVNYAPSAARLELVIKRKPGGALSEWLFGADRMDAVLDLFGPLGRATFRPADDTDLVCIAGGSGIAGIMSILEHATQSGHFSRHRGQVYFGVRTLADGFYLDRFADFVARAQGALRVVLALSDENAGRKTHSRYEAIELAHGFVHDVADRGLAPDLGDVSAFVAGPPVMVDGAIRTLIGHHVPATRIRYDKFG
jgi:toluene monooxygenase electron transfer component